MKNKNLFNDNRYINCVMTQEKKENSSLEY